jgi:hypothetical protein
VHMLNTGLTGGGDRSNQSELADVAALFSSSGRHAFVQGELHWFRGACMCAGGALCGFGALFGGLRSLLEHCFVSGVSSRCPCLRGPRFVFFK